MAKDVTEGVRAVRWLALSPLQQNGFGVEPRPTSCVQLHVLLVTVLKDMRIRLPGCSKLSLSVNVNVNLSVSPVID